MSSPIEWANERKGFTESKPWNLDAAAILIATIHGCLVWIVDGDGPMERVS